MPRLQFPTTTADSTGAGTRVAGSSAFLSLDPADDFGARETHTTFIILEPVGTTSAAADVAEEVFERLRANIEANRSLSATAALLNAVEAVNQWLVQANRLRSAERRVTFGFTCVMARGDEVYIAQAAPSQILIAQEGHLYAFPGLEEWRRSRSDGDAGADESGTLPLGQEDDIQPDLYHTRVEAGDLLVLCSTALAKVIEREPQQVFTTDDPGLVMEHLRTLARDYAVDAVAAAIVVPEHAPRRAQRDFAVLRRVSAWCSHLLPEETAERIRRRAEERAQARPRAEEVAENLAPEVDRNAPDVQTLQYPKGVPGARQGHDLTARDNSFDGTTEINLGDHGSALPFDAESEFDRAPEPKDRIDGHTLWEPDASDRSWPSDARARESRPARGRGRTLTELLAGAILALSAAVVGVWQLAINRDRSIGSPRDDGTLGLPRLNRYDQSVQMPDLTGVRRRLPRAPISRLTGLVAVALVGILATGLFISVRNEQQRERAAKIETALQGAVVQRQQASQAGDPAAAQGLLLAARQSLQEAETLGLDAQRAAQERAAISSDLDRVLRIERLANIQVLGGVPPAPEGVAPRMFFGNGQLFIFTDALYRLEANGSALVRLLGSGDKVGDSVTGKLQGAAWADGAPIVFDGSNAYVFNPASASWTRQKLGTFGSPYTGIMTVYSYSGNLYLLSPSTAQILKFSAGAYEAQPEDWTAGVAADELSSAVDMEIDGRIYVLLKDGRIVDFYRSAVEATITPQVIPPITNAVGLSTQADRPYYYVADDQGRILRLARDGRLVQQFMAPGDSGELRQIRDIVVDDVLSSAYVLTDSALLTVRLPGPPR